MESVKKKLEEVEKAIAMDGSFASTKTGIEFLGTGEQFEKALKQLDDASKVFLTREKEIAVLRSSLVERQRAVERRYEGSLVNRLSDVLLTNPIVAADSVSGILKSAEIPVETVAKPGPAFVWLARFIELWDKSMATVQKSEDLTGDEVNALAESFELLALDALKSNVSPGFRSARHVAHTVRLAKQNRIGTGAEDVIDTQTVDAIAAAAAKTAERASGGVSKLPETDSMVKTLENDVAARQKEIDELAKLIREGAKERAKLTEPIVTAEASLSNGETLGDVTALATVISDLATLESEGNFGTLTNRLRARALMSHGMSEAMLAFLEGDPRERVITRCRLFAWRAYGFDPNVEARWAGKLSPKMIEILNSIKPEAEKKDEKKK